MEELRQRSEQALRGGGAERSAKQHASGKLTARERIDLLLDPGTFRELDRMVTSISPEGRGVVGDGVVSGWGQVDGRQVYLFAQDFTVSGGSLSRANATKIVKVMEAAQKMGAPILSLNDSGGARIQEGVHSLAGYADIFLLNTLLSGVVPQISAIMGPCAGGAVYSPALTDFIFMVQNSAHMFVTGPEVIKAVTHEEVSKEKLGGANTHNQISGVAHFAAQDDPACLAMMRELLSFLPSNNLESPPERPTSDPIDRPNDALEQIIPAHANQPYDMKKVIREIADDHHFFEAHAHFGKSIVVGFARLGGMPVGIVGNQPSVLAGVLDIDSSTKAARFVRFCDAFNLPLVTLEDVPGFLPGTKQEFGGIIRHGAKLLYAFAEATVPKLTVITRKAYGGAYCVMASKHLRTDLNLAFPNAEIAVMGPEGAVNILYRKELGEAQDPVALRSRLVDEYSQTLCTPFVAAEAGYLDEVIPPRDTRKRLAESLQMLTRKRESMPAKKHGNIPL